MGHRRGCTLPELVVAILVLAVGVLALAATAARVSRMVGAGRHATAATALAAQRMELLRSHAQRCAGGAVGSRQSGPYTVTWEVSPVGPRAATVRVVVWLPQAGAQPRADTFATTIPC